MSKLNDGSSKWNVLTTLLVLTKPWDSGVLFKTFLSTLLPGIYSTPNFHWLTLILVTGSWSSLPSCVLRAELLPPPHHYNLPYLRI